MTMQQLSSQANPEVIVNENFETLDFGACYGKKQSTSTGLTWGYYGGRFAGTSISDGTLTLTNSTTNYVVVDLSTGTASVSTSSANWDNPSLYGRVYKLTTVSSAVSATEDHRFGLFGIHSGLPMFRTILSKSAAYSFVGTDAFTSLLHPSADTSARTWTIQANSALALRVGTELEGVNQASAGVITIAITTDTMRLAGAGTTGSRSVAANGWFRIKKITSTEWIIRGEGVT
jgi:hypothetical protein